MSNLSQLLERAVDRVRGMSRTERALMEDQQRRSWVIGETGRDPGPHPLAEEVFRLREQILKNAEGKLAPKEIERLERLKRRAYYIQNQIDSRPERYNMDRSAAELSALCWAIEKISGKPFSTLGESPLNGDA